MSGSIGSPASSEVGGSGFASLAAGSGANSALVRLLLQNDEIVPGSPPSYETCKTIYAYHPLGSKLADGPITMAQSQGRELNIPVLGEKRLVEQFQRTWDATGPMGATVLIHNLMKTARIYGIASIVVGEEGVDSEEPLDRDGLPDADIFFNVLDPLNTSGSLVLNQDPSSPNFLKPTYIVVNGHKWHPSRTCVILNEQPIYIEWSNSAFGFVGRSVYQRCLFPLKTYIQSMITDQMVTQKAGLIIAKMAQPGNFIDNIMKAMFAWKRGHLKSGQTGQVLGIGLDESIETLNMQNLEGAAKFARENMLKNIATAANMPAAMVNNETLTAGFGEGSEDAKQIARYIDFVRTEMQPAYTFVDAIVQRRAWTPEFYETLQRDYEEYRSVPFETAFLDWKRAFKPSWPNLLVEPDSEKIKVADMQFKSVIAVLEVLSQRTDQETWADTVAWAADNINAREELFSSKLEIDAERLREYEPPAKPEGPRMPLAFESET